MHFSKPPLVRCKIALNLSVDRVKCSGGEIAFKIALAYRIFYRKYKIASPISQLSWLFERQGIKNTVKAQGGVRSRYGSVPTTLFSNSNKGTNPQKSPPTVGYSLKFI